MERKGSLAQDVLSSLVVFLVAVPLCLGIALACGFPPAAGLLAGVIGGIVAGGLSGCPLQVTGPAAGLITIVIDNVQRFGFQGFGTVLMLAGLLQFLLGIARKGQWFRAVSPALIQGMLTGIGVVIFAGQFHVMLDDAPRAGGVANLAAIPEAVWKAFLPLESSAHHYAAMLGALSIVVMSAWPRFAVGRLRLVPGSLIGVLAAVALSRALDFPVKYVQVPADLLQGLATVSWDSLRMVSDWRVWAAAAAVAFVASAETLLTAAAVERMATGMRTSYDREVAAQGVGNMLAGALGLLPLTGVIVRSAANVQAGARTRLSTVLHGAWILLFVVLLPGALALIPVSSLAAVLVYTGAKLMNPRVARMFWVRGRAEFAEYLVTAAVVVATDLLTGIMAGFAVAVGRLLWAFSHLELQSSRHGRDWTVSLDGSAHFLILPKLARALESIPRDASVRLDAARLSYTDHACLELIEAWRRSHEAGGGSVTLDWGASRPPVGTRAALRPEPAPGPS